MLNGKRGQIYILAALVLIAIIYGMVAIVNQVTQEDISSDFEELSENYASEGAKLMNTLKEAGSVESTIKESYQDFTRSFTSYSKSQTQNFGLIYAYYYKDDNTPGEGALYLGNFLKTPMLVSVNKPFPLDPPEPDEPLFVSGCYAAVPAGIGYDGISLQYNFDKDPDIIFKKCEIRIPETEGTYAAINTLYITIGADAYTFDIDPSQLEIIMVGREDAQEQRKVYIGGDLSEDTTAITKFTDYCDDKTDDEIYPECNTAYNDICSVAHIKNSRDCKSDKRCHWNPITKTCCMIDPNTNLCIDTSEAAN